MAVVCSFCQLNEAAQVKMTPAEFRDSVGKAVTVVGSWKFIAHKMAPIQYQPASPKAPWGSKSGLTRRLVSRKSGGPMNEDELWILKLRKN